ncbi:MAG: hypothetical protein IT349_05675 [Candidatus Eisenbacteria bacterium]|nr:hypothetical protein [Candidatus Eisenbacteria bacterium]MCC7141576.1 hypothetical protein [Candidatus Eisenbacteria bacterium]
MRTYPLALTAALLLATHSVAGQPNQLLAARPLETSPAAAPRLDRPIFTDDLSHDPLGQVPSHWAALEGELVVVARGADQWLTVGTEVGEASMRIPHPLPRSWNLGFDLLNEKSDASDVALIGFDARGKELWSLELGAHGGDTVVLSAEELESTSILPRGSLTGRHRVEVRANGSHLDAYLGSERVASVTLLPGDAAQSVAFRLADRGQSPLITGVSLTESGDLGPQTSLER